MSCLHRPSAPVVGSAVLAVAVALSGCSSSKVVSAVAGGSATPASSESAPASSGSTPSGTSPASGSTTPTVGTSRTASPSTGGSAIDDTYYPVALGNTWVYKVDYGSKSLGVVTDTEKMIKVEPVSGGTQVTLSRAFHYTTGMHPDFVSTEKLLFHPDGSVSVPYQNSLATMGASVTVTSGDLRLPTPADLAAGKVSNSKINLVVTTAGRKLHATVAAAIKGAGTTSVTVRAGSYKSVRILDETLVEHVTGLGAALTFHARSYLVKGVGIVKTTVGGLTGKPVSGVLVSFTKG